MRWKIVAEINQWTYKQTKLIEFNRKDVFGSNLMEASHEYIFAITARTYIIFPVACDSKTIDQAVKISLLPLSDKLLKVTPIAPLPIKVYRPLSVVTRVKEMGMIIYMLGGTKKKNC